MSGSPVWHIGITLTLHSSKKTVVKVFVVVVLIRPCDEERELTLELDRPGLKSLPRGSWVTLGWRRIR